MEDLGFWTSETPNIHKRRRGPPNNMNMNMNMNMNNMNINEILTMPSPCSPRPGMQ